MADNTQGQDKGSQLLGRIVGAILLLIAVAACGAIGGVIWFCWHLVKG